jgi:hypothetical protein
VNLRELIAQMECQAMPECSERDVFVTIGDDTYRVTDMEVIDPVTPVVRLHARKG